jgi:hypothetical protein
MNRCAMYVLPRRQANTERRKRTYARPCSSPGLGRAPASAIAFACLSRLKAIGLRGIDRYLSKLPATFSPDNDDEAKRRLEQVTAAMELLSRVSLRESESSLDDHWRLACRLYKEPAIRADFRFHEHLRDYFRNLVDATPRDQLIRRLPDLVRLPVAGESDFTVPDIGRWPDPALLAARGISERVWERPPRGWRELSTRLLGLARASDGGLKRDAFLRLVALDDLGALTETERRRLGEIFWAPASPHPALPLTAWGPSTPAFALSLPEPRGINAADRVREYILSTELGAVHGGMVRPEWNLELILFATGPARGEPRPSSRRAYIPWSRADIVRIWDVLRKWWQEHGQALAEQTRTAQPQFLSDPNWVYRFMNNLWEVLRVIVIPHMGP